MYVLKCCNAVPRLTSLYWVSRFDNAYPHCITKRVECSQLRVYCAKSDSHYDVKRLRLVLLLFQRRKKVWLQAMKWLSWAWATWGLSLRNRGGIPPHDYCEGGGLSPNLFQTWSMHHTFNSCVTVQREVSHMPIVSVEADFAHITYAK